MKFLFNKKLKKVWGDDLEVTLVNQEILNNKPVFRKLIAEYYREMAAALQEGGPTLEIGSGGGFFHEHHPHAISSDMLQIPGIDVVCDATQLPFRESSLKNIVMRGVLHHIYDPILFFEECERVLAEGGRVIINDPYISPFSHFIYKYIHFEFCDPEADWKFDRGQPLMDCNLALATIIFKKRLADFKQRLPRLKIVRTNYHTFFIYLLTGGYSYPALIPSWMFEPVMAVERLLKPLRMLLSSTLFIVLEKRGDGGGKD
ncbi:MAG: class I SAM-dependent methyltransferase [Alphaproteobacteria bacterium]|jgi:SAM-dependent methyltransferase|nr:class I SAM-dependent methyltransferase [Alphaproteobacteria bacterium]